MFLLPYSETLNFFLFLQAQLCDGLFGIHTTVWSLFIPFFGRWNEHKTAILAKFSFCAE